jgi:hypothetical protein
VRIAINQLRMALKIIKGNGFRITVTYKYTDHDDFFIAAAMRLLTLMAQRVFNVLSEDLNVKRLSPKSFKRRSNTAVI